MEHSANYLCYLATTGLVKCGKGVVTWFSAPANHIHSAAAFRILPSAFCNSAFYRDPVQIALCYRRKLYLVGNSIYRS